jgi:two-component system sensor histidine kinase KdpD
MRPESVARSRAVDAKRWVLWFGVLTIVGFAMFTVRGRLDKAHVALAFLLVVLWGSSVGGRALGVSLATVAFLVFNWFFLRPYNTLVIADPLDWIVLIVFLFTGVTAAQLLERQRHQAERADQRADEIDRIATLGAENLNAPRAQDALDAIATVIREAMGTDDCIIFLRDDAGLRVSGRSPATAIGAPASGLLAYTVNRAEAAGERADGTVTFIGDAIHAREADQTGQPPLADLRALGIPLIVRDRVVGALRISSRAPFSLTEDQRRVLGAKCSVIGERAERARLSEAEELSEALRRADRLKDSLLAAVSHDLRTPLTAIKGIANEVWRGGDPLRAFTIEQEADRLTALVDDLLELSQLNAGSLRVSAVLNTVDDVVGVALERVEAAHGVGRVRVDIASDGEILVAAVDFAHTVRVLTNLLENAVKYSPPDAPVSLKAWRAGDRVVFAIDDDGVGIEPAERDRIFEPFYRGRAIADGTRGTGLGLAIARQLAEAQHGSLTYAAREGGGSRFVFTVPAGSPPDAIA